VTIKAIGNHNNVRIVATNADEHLFLGVNLFYILRCSLYGVSGTDKYAIACETPGEMVFQDIVYTDCENGVLVDNSNALVNILSNAVYTPTGSTNCGVCVKAGNVTLDFLKVINGSTVTTVMDCDGVNSILTLNNIIGFSPNITTGIRAKNGCRISGYGTRLVGIYDGLVIDGDDTQVRLDVLQIFNAQNDGFRVENVGSGIELALFATTISGCGRYNFNILNPNSITSGNGFTELAKSNVVNGAELYAYLLDTVKGDEGLNILGELHVGSPMSPAESVFGGGDSHIFEYVYTFDGVSTYTDRTDAAISFTGSSFQFDGIGVDNSVYIANRYPMTFEGVKISVDTASVLGSGEIVAEYWNGAWVEFNGCTVKSSPGFLKFAKNYFNQTGSYHIKYNPFIRDDWVTNDPMSLGTDYYWMRFRIKSAITSSPVIQQVKIHTDRTELNTDGTQESHMDARTYKKLVVDAVKPLEGNMQNGSIYVDQDVGVGLENNRFTTAPDLLGVSFELPEDCDTSAPLIFVWKGKFAATGTGVNAVEFTVRRKIVKPGDAYTNTEPGASGETLTILTGSIDIDTANIRGDFRVDLDISDAIPSRENGFGDEIWITLQLSTRGTAGNFDYTKLSANYLSDFNGRHIRQ
jgi:hypothetical protein